VAVTNIELVTQAAEDAPVGALLGVAFRYSVRFILSAVLGLGLTLLLALILPVRSPVETDRMGHALVFDFDPDHLWWVTVMWAVVFPLLTYLSYRNFSRLCRAFPPLATLLPQATDVAMFKPWRKERGNTPLDTPAYGTGRTLIVSFVLIAAAVAARVLSTGHVRVVLVACTLALTASVLGLSKLVSRMTTTPTDQLRSLFTLAAIWLVIPALWTVSHRTVVTKLVESQRVSLSWLPLSVAAITTVSLILFDTFRLKQKGSSHLLAMERSRIIFLVIPLFLFLWTSHAMGDVNDIDVFHHGEMLTGAHRWMSGELPWRDFYFNVGFLPAVLVPRISFQLFGSSFWGMVNGDALIFTPALIVALYVGVATLVRKSTVFLCLVTIFFLVPQKFLWGFAEILHGDETLFVFRFIPLALLPIPLVWFLRSRRWTAAVVLSFTLLVNVLLAAEMIVYLGAVALVVIVADLADWRTGTRPWKPDSLTLRLAVCGVFATSVMALFLQWWGVLPGFVDWWLTFPSGWHLETAIPINAEYPFFKTPTAVLILPPVLFALVVFYVLWRLHSRTRLSAEDWTAIALSVGGLIFYRKTAIRPDTHVYQALIAVLPVLLYMVHKSVEMIGDAIEPMRTGIRRYSAGSLTWIFVAPIVLMPFAPPFTTFVDIGTALPTRFNAISTSPVIAPRLGNYVDGVFAEKVLALKGFFRQNLPKGYRIYDFSNSSSLYNFLLNEKPVSKYSYVVQSATQESQQEVISALKQVRPEVVVYASREGLNQWDKVINPVRHYDISEFILRNYSPWIDYYGETLMLRNDLVGTPSMASSVPVPDKAEAQRLLRSSFDATDPGYELRCNWGAAAQFLTTRPSDKGTPINSAPAVALLSVRGWTPALNDSSTRVIVKVDGQVVMDGETSLPRPDLALPTSQTGERPGFWFDIPLTTSGEKVEVFRMDSEVLTPILTENSASGHIDVQQLEPTVDGKVRLGLAQEMRHVTVLELPESYQGYSWVLINGLKPIAANNFLMYDQALDGKRAIAFSSNGKHKVVGAHAAACPTWFGWSTSRLYLQSDQPLGDVAITLHRNGSSGQ
jgi:hypothetical protein